MSNYGKILIALGSGIAAGAILGILFAPDKGSVTRKKISDAAGDLSDKVKTMKDSLTEKVKSGANGHNKNARVTESVEV